jgi:IS1 family transposase
MKVRIDASDFSLADIANLFGFTKNHLRLDVANKKLIAYKLGKCNYVTRDNLKNWLMNGMADEIINRGYKVSEQGMEILKPFIGS